MVRKIAISRGWGTTVLPRRTLACCVLAAAGVGIAGIACDDGSPRTPLPTLSPRPMPAEPLPTFLVDEISANGFSDLDPDLQRLTEEVISSDETILRIAGTSPLNVGSIGPAYSGRDPETGAEVLIGSFATVTLTAPQDHERIEVPTGEEKSYYHAWPDDLQARYPAYASRTAEFHVQNLTQFQVHVDLAQRRVVNVDFMVWAIEGQVAEYLGGQDYQISEGPERARRIADKDQAVRRVLEGKDAAIIGGSDDWGEHHFAWLIARWDSSEQVEADLPVIVDQDPITGDYRSEVVHIADDNIWELEMLIDMDSNQLIQARPREGD